MCPRFSRVKTRVVLSIAALAAAVCLPAASGAAKPDEMRRPVSGRDAVRSQVSTRLKRKR